MNKKLLLTFVLIISLTFTLPHSVFAWKSATHQALVENIYNSMPPSLQEKLNLTLMKEGAVAPDLVFHDTVNHHYPVTKDLAYKYLEKIQTVNDFSYNFGVAAHYISDSFAAPHNVQKEDSYLHGKFESQVLDYTITTDCANYNYTLNDLGMVEKNSEDWYLWLDSQDSSIPKKELEQAQKFLYSIAIQKLGYECNSLLEYDEKPLINTNPSDIIQITGNAISDISIPGIPKNLTYPVIIAVFLLLIILKIFKRKR